MKKVMTFLVVAVMLIMRVGSQTPAPPSVITPFAPPPPPPPPPLPPAVITVYSPPPPQTHEADHPTVTTTSPVTITIYIPAAEAEPSHHIIDIFFFVFGFVGLILLAILCIIMWLVFRIIGRRI
jgi:hypothetical protein